MFDFFFGLALILFGLPPSGDTIAANGFEELSVYISTDRPEAISWLITSSHSNAAFVTSASYLVDGKVAVPTRITGDIGSPVGPIVAEIQLQFSGALTVPNNGILAFAMLCPKTPYAIPVDVLVAMQVFNASAVPLSYQARTVTFNNGATGIIGAVKNTTGSDFIIHGPFGGIVTIYNDKTGSPQTWATSGQTLDIGEFWFGNARQFNLATDPKMALIDPTLMRRSHSNQPWPLFLKPYKQWTFNFTPMSNTAAYNSASTPSFDSVRYSLAAANCALVLPRIYTPGTTTINTVDLNQLACFGQAESVGELASVQNSNGAWRASMVFGEVPP